MSERRIRRVKRWRLAKPVRGTAEKPRLVVNRGLRTIQAHFVNDEDGKVICGASTASKKLAITSHGCEAARSLGKELARVAREKGITKTVFDRNGYLYHGRVKALAEGVREGGLEF